MHLEGVAVVGGPLPQDIQLTTIFYAAIRSAATRHEAAAALLAFMV